MAISTTTRSFRNGELGAAHSSGGRPPSQDAAECLHNEIWATPKLKRDLLGLAKQYCSEDDVKWFLDILKGGNLTRVVYDGAYGDGGKPGSPAHASMVRARNGRCASASLRNSLQILGPVHPTGRPR
eukprot:g79767.t1